MLSSQSVGARRSFHGICLAQSARRPALLVAATLLLLAAACSLLELQMAALQESTERKTAWGPGHKACAEVQAKRQRHDAHVFDFATVCFIVRPA